MKLLVTWALMLVILLTLATGLVRIVQIITPDRRERQECRDMQEQIRILRDLGNLGTMGTEHFNDMSIPIDCMISADLTKVRRDSNKELGYPPDYNYSTSCVYRRDRSDHNLIKCDPQYDPEYAKIKYSRPLTPP